MKEIQAWRHMPVIPGTWKAEVGDTEFKVSSGIKVVRPIPKNKIKTKGWDIAQMAQHLPKYELRS
jgi:hypothetical protein